MEICGIVSLIASEQFAINPPPGRIGKPSNMVLNMDIWMLGYLDSGKKQFVAASQFGLVCGAALPGAFFYRKSRSLVL